MVDSFRTISRLASNQKNDIIPPVSVGEDRATEKLWVKAIVSNIGKGRKTFIGHKVGIIHGSNAINRGRWKEGRRTRRSWMQRYFLPIAGHFQRVRLMREKSVIPFRLPEWWIKHRAAIKKDYFFISNKGRLCQRYRFIFVIRTFVVYEKKEKSFPIHNLHFYCVYSITVEKVTNALKYSKAVNWHKFLTKFNKTYKEKYFLEWYHKAGITIVHSSTAIPLIASRANIFKSRDRNAVGIPMIFEGGRP